MTALTLGQTKARIESTCDSIWRMGDRDECSIKHIGHALAAISHGKRWEDGVDYPTPWGEPVTYVKSRDELIEWSEDHTRQMEKRLAAAWSKVEHLRDEVGLAQFNAAVSASKFYMYWAQYNKDYWEVTA